MLDVRETAHELNNLLGAILTRAYLLEVAAKAGGPPALADVKAIRHAIPRAAELVKRLAGEAERGGRGVRGVRGVRLERGRPGE